MYQINALHNNSSMEKVGNATRMAIKLLTEADGCTTNRQIEVQWMLANDGEVTDVTTNGWLTNGQLEEVEQIDGSDEWRELLEQLDGHADGQYTCPLYEA